MLQICIVMGPQHAGHMLWAHASSIYPLFTGQRVYCGVLGKARLKKRASVAEMVCECCLANKNEDLPLL